GLGLFLVEEGKFRLVEFFEELAPGEHIQRLSLGSKSGRKIPGSARLFVSATADGFAPRASAQWRMVSWSCLTLALDMAFYEGGETARRRSSGGGFRVSMPIAIDVI